jgi:hypothetical protein
MSNFPGWDDVPDDNLLPWMVAYRNVPPAPLVPMVPIVLEEFFPLPDFSIKALEVYFPPVPIGIIGLPPPPLTQRWFDLPRFDFFQEPAPRQTISFIPPVIPYQPGPHPLLWLDLPSFDFFQQPAARQTITYVPPVVTPYTGVLHQLQWFDLPLFDFYQQKRLLVVPYSPYTHFMGVAQLGCCRILNTFALGAGGSQLGISRVGNLGIQGYTVRIGRNAPPDFNAPPDGFGTTLPISVPAAPPLSGTDTLYVVVRNRNQYGLESQNQQAILLQLSSTNVMTLPPVAAPTNVTFTQRPAGKVQVTAQYTQYEEVNAADIWQLWVSAVPIVPGSAPSVNMPVTGFNFNQLLTGFTAGVTYYLGLGLFRSADAAQSPMATATFTYLAAPLPPLPVAGAGIL